MIKKYIISHRNLFIFFSVVIIIVTTMAITDTLSYPYILIDRQIILSKYCNEDGGIRNIPAPRFNFTVNAPEGYCSIPNRLFPEDGSIQIVPKGRYNVIKEYGSGQIVNATMASVLYEQLELGRDPESLIQKMREGGFLGEATISMFVNPNGLNVWLVKNATGIDLGSHYNWAFVLNKENTALATILTSHPENPEVFMSTVNSLSPVQ